MTFESYSSMMLSNYKSMLNTGAMLFTVRCDADALYEHYMNSFPEGTNPIYRVRREFDCSECRRFIRQMGNVVALLDGEVRTIWGFPVGDLVYDAVNGSMDGYLKNLPIEGVFLTNMSTIGTAKTLEVIDGKVTAWHHFSLPVPARSVYKGPKTIDGAKAEYRDNYNVLGRSLNEITLDAVETVLELIDQNSLYRGEEWKKALCDFRSLKLAHGTLCNDREKELFLWKAAVECGVAVARIRNHSIGTLLLDLSAYEELDVAVRKYEAVVAPTNYKRPKAIFTRKMLEDAKQKISDLGFMDSLGRRHARLDDITVNNILFCDRDAAKRVQGADIFSTMAASIAVNPRRFDRVEEIPADKFIRDVLPNARKLEVLMESRHIPSLVSLISPENREAKPMFKWNNGFSWAYKGNITDSDIRKNVKNAGGDVDGVLRFSIQWNDTEFDPNDLDAHCVTPSNNEIYYASKTDYKTGGKLDVDIINPRNGTPAVENITWPFVERMHSGKYRFFVHCFSQNGGDSGFRAEIAFNGQIYSYQYNRRLRENEEVTVATVTLDKDGNFSIEEHLDSSVSTVNIWGIGTNQFVPVSTVMYSPNYWDDQSGIGHKHVFFMLDGCVNNEQPNGVYNEFLVNELMEHRRVMEAMGSAMKAAPADDQLSGLGFSTTKRNDVIVKVVGASERILKVKF